MANDNFSIPNRPQNSPLDKPLETEPDQEERVQRTADRLAHKGIEREHEVDDQQRPFNK